MRAFHLCVTEILKITEKCRRNSLITLYIFFERENVHYLFNLLVGKIPKLRAEFGFLHRSSCDTVAFSQSRSIFDYISIFLSHYHLKIMTEFPLSYFVWFGTAV